MLNIQAAEIKPARQAAEIKPARLAAEIKPARQAAEIKPARMQDEIIGKKSSNILTLSGYVSADFNH